VFAVVLSAVEFVSSCSNSIIFLAVLSSSNTVITPLAHRLSDHDAQLLTINESFIIKSLKEILSPFMICNIYF
jgi:hypothetical protein